MFISLSLSLSLCVCVLRTCAPTQVAKLEPEGAKAEQMRQYAREAADYLSQVDYDQ